MKIDFCVFLFDLGSENTGNEKLKQGFFLQISSCLMCFVIKSRAKFFIVFAIFFSKLANKLLHASIISSLNLYRKFQKARCIFLGSADEQI